MRALNTKNFDKVKKGYKAQSHQPDVC